VARRNCAAYGNVTIEEAEFERWQPDGRPFRLLFSAQAWHWVAPDIRYVRARAALEPGAALAPFWNIPDWGACELREELRKAYTRSGDPNATNDPFNPSAQPGDDDWLGEIAATPGFDGAEVRLFRWSSTYTTREYIELLGTQSANLVLPDAQRERLQADIAGVIDGAGGAFELPYVTQLCLARAA
jgi:hypothetical protein